MLSQLHRLSRSDFHTVKKSGQKLFLNNFLIYHSPSQHLKASVIVSKKLAKQAVLRNKLRRLIYHHLNKKYLNLKQNLLIYPQKYEIDISLLDQVLSKLS